jgi:hypothetical protein
MVPSLLLLSRIRRRRRDGDGALVVGDPTSDLPAARQEAIGVAERYRTEPLLGPRAVKAAFLERLGGSDPVHIAAHASFDADSPWTPASSSPTAWYQSAKRSGRMSVPISSCSRAASPV